MTIVYLWLYFWATSNEFKDVLTMRKARVSFLGALASLFLQSCTMSAQEIEELLGYVPDGFEDEVQSDLVQQDSSVALAVQFGATTFEFPQSETLLNTDVVDRFEPKLDVGERRAQAFFGTTLERVSSSASLEVDNVLPRHFYSKRQAWNADQTLIDIADKIVDVETKKIVVGLVPITSERNWSNLNPELIYGVAVAGAKNAFASYNVNSEQMTELISLEDFTSCTLGRFEGNISLDDRYAVLICDELNGGATKLLSIDILNKQIMAALPAESNINWASFSSSGRYILVENNLFPDENPELLRYDPFFQERTFLAKPTHGDIGIDAEGNEVYVMAGADFVNVVRIADTMQYVLAVTSQEKPIGFGHISCRNILRPGWCYFSSRNNQWLGALKISPTDVAIEHWGYHRASYSSYSAEAHATPDRLGSQLMFASDWLGAEEISSYVLDVPEIN